MIANSGVTIVLMAHSAESLQKLAYGLPGPVFLCLRACFRLWLRIARIGTRPEYWNRVVMDRATLSMIESASPAALDALEVSGDSWGNRVAFKSYTSLHFPNFDICTSVAPILYDLVIAEQVFEHLLWPYRAGRNVYESLRPGGLFLITTPFLVRVHDAPSDCSRWTETGLAHFLAECGFPLEQVETGSWGNKACLRANLAHWPRYRPWLHSLRNDRRYPNSVWALARK
jgi:SAM-dependent methyltransferase